MQAVQLLLVHGADLHVANSYGHTPLSLSCKGSSVRHCLLQLLEGPGPEERQRLQAALKLRHQQSLASRESAQLAAQLE